MYKVVINKVNSLASAVTGSLKTPSPAPNCCYVNGVVSRSLQSTNYSWSSRSTCYKTIYWGRSAAHDFWVAHNIADDLTVALQARDWTPADSDGAATGGCVHTSRRASGGCGGEEVHVIVYLHGTTDTYYNYYAWQIIIHGKGISIVIIIISMTYGNIKGTAGGIHITYPPARGNQL